ncbi:hypothetical protein E6O75_ATG10620 [Venturia nashicola]|uniref:Uncharacterized protein n=1 Tax=Venturia nashicola TaxID=86259 RepID=A0A4Z1P9E9_9PEZI|nr:hypothetical protein E6O75_ATG10620 [Venturia nashicola]
MFTAANPFEALRGLEEEGEDKSGGSERAASPKKPTIGERVVHSRGKSSSAAAQSAPSPLRRLDNLKSPSTSRPSSIVSPTRPTGEPGRPLSVTSFSLILAESNRRKSLTSLSVEDSRDRRESISTPSIEDVLSRRSSIPSLPIDESQHRRMSAPSIPFDESRIYNRGVKIEAKVCKVHFSAWRRNLHRGCEDKGCPLHHDPRGWPARVVDIVPSGPIKELLEIQRDIDIVLGKGEFDVDTALVKLKPGMATPPRGRERRDEHKTIMLETEDLSPEALAAKGRRIQEIWDESLRLYRLRKENPDAAFVSIRKRPQVEDRSQALSFF